MATTWYEHRVLQIDGSHVDEAGALVIGGDYRGLGIVRSLGRRNIPVWVLQDRHDLAGFSRYAAQTHRWPHSTAERQVEYLLALGKQHRLDGWTLFPTTNRVAAVLAQHRDQLMSIYRVTTPQWELIDWACDKRLTYELAQQVGLIVPRTQYPVNRRDVESFDCAFPVLLKSAMEDGDDSFSRAKVWRANDRQSLLTRYDEACTVLDPSTVLIQELIPGGAECQLSYAGLWLDGRPVAGFVAQLTRHYPADLGHLPTLVETIRRPQVEEASRRLLSATSYSGLVEIEYKYDHRDGRLKLLDVNPRIWAWHTLGHRVGIDFPYLQWLVARGEQVPDFMPPKVGLRWSYFVPNMLPGVSQIRTPHLSLKEYFRSLRASGESAIFAQDDPQPALVEGSIRLKDYFCRIYRRNRTSASKLSMPSRDDAVAPEPSVQRYPKS